MTGRRVVWEERGDEKAGGDAHSVAARPCGTLGGGVESKAAAPALGL